MPPHERKLIGVIEDDPIMGGTLVHRLELEGYRPLWWQTGQEALEALGTARPDLVICDVMMPELDGYGVLTELRAAPATAKLPFIFLTAKSDKLDLRRGMNLGADDYLTKPVLREDLLEAVKTRLTRHRAHKAALNEVYVGSDCAFIIRCFWCNAVIDSDAFPPMPFRPPVGLADAAPCGNDFFAEGLLVLGE